MCKNIGIGHSCNYEQPTVPGCFFYAIFGAEIKKERYGVNMNELSIIVKPQLPTTIEDLQKFVLIGREKLIAVRAEFPSATSGGGSFLC